MSLTLNELNKQKYSIKNTWSSFNKWYEENTSNLSKLKSFQVLPGYFYTYKYNPKYKDIMYIWDRLPYVFVYKTMKDHFMGINFHIIENLELRKETIYTFIRFHLEELNSNRPFISGKVETILKSFPYMNMNITRRKYLKTHVINATMYKIDYEEAMSLSRYKVDTLKYNIENKK